MLYFPSMSNAFTRTDFLTREEKICHKITLKVYAKQQQQMNLSLGAAFSHGPAGALATAGSQPCLVPAHHQHQGESPEHGSKKLQEESWIYRKKNKLLPMGFLANLKTKEISIFSMAFSKLSNRPGLLCALWGSPIRPLCSTALALYYMLGILC